MATEQTIELNGNTYDATSGRLISSGNPGQNLAKHVARSTAKTIDGVIGITKKPADSQHNHTSLPKKHTVAPHAKRAVEHSKTLMRKVVKQPPPKNKITPDQNTHTSQTKKIVNSITQTVPSPMPIAKDLVNRAQNIPKSEFVTRYNHLATKQLDITKDSPENVDNVYAKRVEMLKTIDKTPAATNNSVDDLALAALEKADSHQAVARKESTPWVKAAKKVNLAPRTFVISVICIVLVLAAGLITYSYHNNLILYVDNSKSGLKTSLPSYVEPGFGLSSISRAGSSVTLKYSSNSDSRNYSIVEQSSTWDSQSLVDGVVEPAVGSSFTTAQVNGRIVYFYGDNAVWVDGFVYYRLVNNANLTSDQISQIINGI